jgi:hypothetical protein
VRGTAPVARALARAAARRDSHRLTKHEDAARYGWKIDYDGDILVTVTLKACAATYQPGQTDTYVLTLDCDSYDLWPPETRFVNPKTRTYIVGQDLAALPNIQGVSNFGLHPSYNGFATVGRVDQLVCFSFTRGYYDSNHAPQQHERWIQGRHWLYSTVRYLHRALQSPFYQGRMAPQ